MIMRATHAQDTTWQWQGLAENVIKLCRVSQSKLEQVRYKALPSRCLSIVQHASATSAALQRQAHQSTDPCNYGFRHTAQHTTSNLEKPHSQAGRMREFQLTTSRPAIAAKVRISPRINLVAATSASRCSYGELYHTPNLPHLHSGARTHPIITIN